MRKTVTIPDRYSGELTELPIHPKNYLYNVIDGEGNIIDCIEVDGSCKRESANQVAFAKLKIRYRVVTHFEFQIASLFQFERQNIDFVPIGIFTVKPLTCLKHSPLFHSRQLPAK